MPDLKTRFLPCESQRSWLETSIWTWKTLYPTLRRFFVTGLLSYAHWIQLLVDLLPQKWHSPTNRQKSDLTLQRTGSDLTKKTIWPYKNGSLADLKKKHVWQKSKLVLGLTLTTKCGGGGGRIWTPSKILLLWAMNLLFFKNAWKNRNSLKKFFLFENLLFRKSYFEKYVFFTLPPILVDPVALSTLHPRCPVLLAQADMIHILLLEKVWGPYLL